MDKYKLIAKIRELYDNGGNIIRFLKEENNEQSNSIEDILISYDFQSGSYIAAVEKNPDFTAGYTKKIADVLASLGEVSTVLEAGVGEATTLTNVLTKSAPHIGFGGFDISWSRVAYGNKYLGDKSAQAFLCTGDLFSAPFADSSIDIVYTSHSIEPNGGREKEALQELYRIANKYLVLLEPTDEFATEEGKNRMRLHGYVSNLKGHILELGYKLIRYEPFGVSVNPLNPTGLYIIEKNADAPSVNTIRPACPISKHPLVWRDGVYFCEESLLSYPQIKNVPCLTPQNAILTTKFLDV